jgi:hypothetical protein
LLNNGVFTFVWAWHLNDGLGSMRQLADGEGNACWGAAVARG